MQQGQSYTTKKGHELIALALTGVPIRFTRVMLGDGQISSLQEAMTLNSLKNPLKIINLTENNIKVLKTENNTNTGKAQITIPISNLELETGFFMREIGIFAEDPRYGEILFSVISENENPIFLEPEMNTPTGDLETMGINIKVNVVIGNAPNVEVYLQNNLVYVTWADLEELAGVGRINQTVKGNWDLIKKLQEEIFKLAIGGATGSDENTIVLQLSDAEGLDDIWGIFDVDNERLVG